MADPNTVLTQLATDLRHRVDTLIAPIQASQKWTTSDSANVCQFTSQAEWPKQWGYSVTLQLTPSDARPLARQVADQLHAQGWTLRDDSRADLARIVAQQDGTSIQIQGLAAGGRFGVGGASACVRADGTIDHSAVP